VLDFFAFFAAFFATFASFFTALELLVFFAIWCGPPIVVAASRTALCMSQGPADGVGSLRCSDTSGIGDKSEVIAARLN
jgi:hypothetical protein